METASTVGTRNLAYFGSGLLGAYSDTVFYFSTTYYPQVQGQVALTIDDGLCRQDISCSLVSEVLELLRKYKATATFFVCSNYLRGMEDMARDLLNDGHELGNHCPEDREYASLAPSDFEAALLETSAGIEAITREQGCVNWFRAPQARLTGEMHTILQKHGLRHALGDCYCDDWAIEDPEYVASTLLSQAQDGSVIVMHMPERGFREHTLRALELLLQGLTDKGLHCETLSSLVARAEEPLESKQPSSLRGAS